MTFNLLANTILVVVLVEILNGIVFPCPLNKAKRQVAGASSTKSQVHKNTFHDIII